MSIMNFNSLIHTDVIYPAVRIEYPVIDDEYGTRHIIECHTYLRKCFDGVWYVTKFLQIYQVLNKSLINVEIQHALERLHSEIYFFQILGKFIPTQFIKDEFQDTEEERLRTVYPHLKPKEDGISK